MGQEVKNLLRAQSKYGLMGSSAKTGKKISTGQRSNFWIKLSFWIGHPPTIHQMQCIWVGEGSRVPNLQTEFNYLDLFKSNGIVSDFVVPTSSPHCPYSPQKVPMWSPWLLSLLSPPGTMWGPCHVIPFIPVSSPHPLEGAHIIPNLPDTHPTHPHPLGGWGPKSVKML